MIDFGIIAAGESTRIKREGSLVPKPLVEIDGCPMIGRLINLMSEAGAESVSVVINEDMTEVFDYLRELVATVKCGLKIKTVKTPSSMHSFYELLQLMKPADKFIVTTVDTIFRQNEFTKYVEYFRNSPHGIDGVMGVTSYIDDESPLYVETEGRHRITAYKDIPFEGCKYVSAGVYGLHTSAIPVLQQCMDAGVIRMRNFQRQLLINGQNLDVYDLGEVIDVDHLEDIEKANRLLSSE